MNSGQLTMENFKRITDNEPRRTRGHLKNQYVMLNLFQHLTKSDFESASETIPIYHRDGMTDFHI